MYLSVSPRRISLGWRAAQEIIRCGSRHFNTTFKICMTFGCLVLHAGGKLVNGVRNFSGDKWAPSMKFNPSAKVRLGSLLTEFRSEASNGVPRPRRSGIRDNGRRPCRYSNHTSQHFFQVSLSISWTMGHRLPTSGTRTLIEHSLLVFLFTVFEDAGLSHSLGVGTSLRAAINSPPREMMAPDSENLALLSSLNIFLSLPLILYLGGIEDIERSGACFLGLCFRLLFRGELPPPESST